MVFEREDLGILAGRSMRALAIALLASVGLFAPARAANLVPNGDFESGNTGFSTDYAYSPALNTTEGQYTVRTNPYPWNALFVSIGDHTTGAGQMLVANGSPSQGAILWRSQTISIASNTDYVFGLFATNVCCNAPFPNNTPALSFLISLDGGASQTLTTLNVPLYPAGVWRSLQAGFNSGGATSVTLSLVDADTAVLGNDCAIDDISLEPGTVTGVPEPGAWAVTLLGLGALGGELRRRRSLARRAAA